MKKKRRKEERETERDKQREDLFEVILDCCSMLRLDLVGSGVPGILRLVIGFSEHDPTILAVTHVYLSLSPLEQITGPGM